MQTLASLPLTPESDAVTQAQAWLESVGEQQQWPMRVLFKLNLCLEEALTNVVMHGFPEGHDAGGEPAIMLSVLGQDDAVTVELADNGVAFDPTRAASPELAESLDAADMGGHGLRLMHHYLSSIQYERKQGYNHLWLNTTLAAADGGT